MKYIVRLTDDIESTVEEFDDFPSARMAFQDTVYVLPHYFERTGRTHSVSYWIEDAERGLYENCGSAEFGPAQCGEWAGHESGWYLFFPMDGGESVRAFCDTFEEYAEAWGDGTVCNHVYRTCYVEYDEDQRDHF